MRLPNGGVCCRPRRRRKPSLLPTASRRRRAAPVRPHDRVYGRQWGYPCLPQRSQLRPVNFGESCRRRLLPCPTPGRRPPSRGRARVFSSTCDEPGSIQHCRNLWHLASTRILYRVCYDPPPMNTPVREGETIEGSRTMRNRPYPVLKCSSTCCWFLSV